MNNLKKREEVLGAIRRALAVDGKESSRQRTVQERIKSHPANLIPKRAQANRAARIKLFIDTLEGQSAHVSRAGSLKEIPQIVANYLRDNNLPAEFRSGEDELLGGIPWEKAPSLTRHQGKGEASDAVTISAARTAAAETGTMFLTSGADNPTTLNFLPDTHIAVIRAKDILGSYEDAWNALRKLYGARAMPRTVNLISGPSRTADIEQIIVMGAHGPRRLHVIVVD
ncbi:MAG: LutC/YkgG family protein [Alphaproteobacteria bacterium]